MADDSSEIVREGAEVVGFNDVKSVGEAGAILQNLAIAQSVAHQQAAFAHREAMLQLYPALVAKSSDRIMHMQAEEGAVAAGILQQLIKGAQSTNPQTGQPLA